MFQLRCFPFYIPITKETPTRCSENKTTTLRAEQIWAQEFCHLNELDYRATRFYIFFSGRSRIGLRVVLPILIFSVIYNIPRFFELEVVRTFKRVKIEETVTLSNGSKLVQTTYENRTDILIDPTALRLHDDYVFYYVNVSGLIFTLFIPFVSLIVLNTLIYR